MSTRMQATLGEPGARRRPLPAVWPLGWVVGTLLAWQRRLCERDALAALDDRLLADIGLTRAQARREAGKPFWRR